MQIKEISETIGFDDPFYFCRLFSEVYGISPKHYRKEYQLWRHIPFLLKIVPYFFQFVKIDIFIGTFSNQMQQIYLILESMIKHI